MRVYVVVSKDRGKGPQGTDKEQYRARLFARPGSYALMASRVCSSAGEVRRDLERELGPLPWRGVPIIAECGFHDSNIKWIAALEVTWE